MGSRTGHLIATFDSPVRLRSALHESTELDGDHVIASRPSCFHNTSEAHEGNFLTSPSPLRLYPWNRAVLRIIRRGMVECNTVTASREMHVGGLAVALATHGDPRLMKFRLTLSRVERFIFFCRSMLKLHLRFTPGLRTVLKWLLQFKLCFLTSFLRKSIFHPCVICACVKYILKLLASDCIHIVTSRFPRNQEVAVKIVVVRTAYEYNLLSR